MPPLPRLRIPALAELARQLRFTPPKAARRQLEAAEALAADLDPAAAYPEEWVLFRLTGYRAEVADPAMIVGAALLAELSPLVEHLCAAARLRQGDLGDPAGWLSAMDLCERWRVSRKTLDRYRRQGLLARRVAVENGRMRHRLVFARSCVERFEQSARMRLAAAGGFSRIEPEVEQRMLRRARRYRQRLGWSRGHIAARLAERFGRSHETVRQLLMRHDSAAAERWAGRGDGAAAGPIFAQPGAARPVVRELIERAYDRGCGVEPAALAQRHGLSVASVYRIIASKRAQRLRDLLPAGRAMASAAAERPAAATAHLLDHPAARTGLGAPGPATLADLHAFVLTSRPEGPKLELARAAAFVHLRQECLERIARLPRRDPSIAELDEIETRLRWAARLKAELVRSQLPLAVKTIHPFLSGRELVSLPPRAAARLVEIALQAIIEGVERFDPSKGGRVAAPVALALNRAVSQWARGEGAGLTAPAAPSLASPRADPQGTPLPDFTRAVSTWQTWLEPDPRVRANLGVLPGELAQLLAERHAWPLASDGGGSQAAGPPQTLAAIAARRGVTPARISRLEHHAMRLALGLPESPRPARAATEV